MNTINNTTRNTSPGKLMKTLIFCLLFMVIASQVKSQLRASYKMPLNDGWQFHEAGKQDWKTATVPGCVHTDLMANEVIDDVFFEDNAKKCKWIETKDWEYELTFIADAKLTRGDHVDLIFEGLDTYADVFLNDKKVLEASDMFLGYSIPVKDYLITGENKLRIYFHSPVNISTAKFNSDSIKYPDDNDENRSNIYTRKAAYQYGWDIAPRMVSSGIWRPVYLEAWNGAKITDLYIRPIKISEKKARYEAEVNIESDFAGDLQLLIKDYRDNEIEVKKLLVKGDLRNIKIKVPISIKNPEMWSPNGSGKQKLYNLDIEVIAGNNVYSVSKQIGVRKIEVVNKPDKYGKSFYVKVNDKPTYMKGVNSVPLSVFPSQVSKDQYKKFFYDLKTNNVNMIRVWGGGIYEDDYFYQLADENGILVWQDFMFSGAMYPSDSAFIELVKAEAVYNVKRLRNHPSLAMWCGNNEIQVAWDNWGWQQTYSLSKATANLMYAGYKKIFDQVLPEVVTSLDSGIFYFPSSPQSNWGKPSDFKSGDNHYWGVWHGEKAVESFTTEIPRFASEFGLPSLPEMNSIARFAPASAMESPTLKDRMRSYKGLGLLKKYADDNYPYSETLSDFSYTTNVLQADAVVAGITAQRASKPYCMGSLYWQANDCWPGITWSSVDYYGKWKALQYRTKDAFSNLVMTLKTDSMNSVFSIVNDGDKSNSAMLDLHLESFDGLDLWRKNFHVKIKSNENTLLVIDSLSKIVAQLGKDKIDLVAILYNDEGVLLQQHFFFDKTKNLLLPAVEFSKDVCEYGKGYMLTLSTVNLAKNVFLSLANSDATFSDNYFDMLPGDVKQIEISSVLPINEVISNLKIRTMKDEQK